MECQSFCLKWDGYQTNVTGLIESLRQADELVDITLCCEGRKIRAHRIILSVCSPYFRDVLKDNMCQHMVFYMRDTSASDLAALVEFMYSGRVNVPQNQLGSFIKTAEALQIRGLCGDDDQQNRSASQPPPPLPPLHRQPPKNYQPHSPQQPPMRRPVLSPSGLSSSGLSSGSKRRRRASDHSPDPSAGPPVVLNSPKPQQRVDGSDTQDVLAAADDRDGVGRSAPSTPQEEVAENTLASTSSLSSFPPASSAVSIPPSGAAGSGGGDVDESDSVDHETSMDQFDSSVKIEKIDLTEDEAGDEASLEATLGQVAEFEGFEGMGHSTLESGDYASHLAIPEYANASLRSLDPGSSALGEEGQSQDRVLWPCRLCLRVFRTRHALRLHTKVHAGLTTCVECWRVFNQVSDLRRHLRAVHSWSRDQAMSYTLRQQQCSSQQQQQE